MTVRSLTRAASRGEAGFTLIELMVGMGIGLLCTLVVAAVLGAAEGRRRGTMQGSDMQVSGSVALYSLQREIALAGYGFANEAASVGCALQVRFNNAVPAVMPTVLAPVTITQGAVGVSDQVRVLASAKFINGNPTTLSTVGYTVPTRIVGPYYDPATSVNTVYNVWSSLSVAQGDLMVAVIGAGLPCGLFQVTGVPTAGSVPRANQPTGWNPAGHPAQAAVANSLLVNLGRLSDVILTSDANAKLTVSRLDTSTLSRTQTELQGNIVLMKAMYGRDTNGDGVVDTYDYSTPTTNAGWLNVLTIRLAVAARSAQYEKEEVTASLPLWDVGASTAVTGTVDCNGNSKCLALKVDNASDWKHYRYKIFDTVVPLRNQRWRS